MKTSRHITYPALEFAANSNSGLFGKRSVLFILVVISFLLATLAGLAGFLCICATEPPVRWNHFNNPAYDKRDLPEVSHLEAKEKAAPFIKRSLPYEKDTD